MPEGEEEQASRRQAQRKQSESLSNEIRKRFRTAKADREFDRTIGARERARARMEEQERGSRAAVYDMRMGASQRKSVRAMAEGDKKRSKGFSLPFALPFNGSLSAWATRTVVAFVAVAFAVVMLYPSCQNYYNETRQLQQLQAEYDALQEYNTQMQNSGRLPEYRCGHRRLCSFRAWVDTSRRARRFGRGGLPRQPTVPVPIVVCIPFLQEA